MPGKKFQQIIVRSYVMLLIPAIQVIYFILNRNRLHMHRIGTYLDNLIPFNKFFIAPYVYWYFFVFAILIFFLFADHELYYLLVASIITGTLICFVFFYFYPTMIIRPIVSGNDFFSDIVRDVYTNDNPYNCFPSIHVLDAILPTLYLIKYKKNKILVVVSVISSILISASTLFVKQHYFYDVIAAAVLAVSVYLFYNNNYIRRRLFALGAIAFSQFDRKKVAAEAED